MRAQTTKKQEQCPGFAFVTELIESVAAGKVDLRDLIGVTGTFLSLLQQLQRLQSRDDDDDDSESSDGLLSISLLPSTVTVWPTTRSARFPKAFDTTTCYEFPSDGAASVNSEWMSGVLSSTYTADELKGPDEMLEFKVNPRFYIDSETGIKMVDPASVPVWWIQGRDGPYDDDSSAPSVLFPISDATTCYEFPSDGAASVNSEWMSGVLSSSISDETNGPDDLQTDDEMLKMRPRSASVPILKPPHDHEDAEEQDSYESDESDSYETWRLAMNDSSEASEEHDDKSDSSETSDNSDE